MLSNVIMVAGALAVAQADTAPQMSEAERVARAYMVEYSEMDLDGMVAFWADDIHFLDATALGEGIGPDGHELNGAEEAREFLQAFVDNYRPIELGFVWDTVFESNDRVIFMGHVNALYPTETEGQVFRWRSPQVTVLTVRDGEITEQLDFADYDDPDRSLVTR